MRCFEVCNSVVANTNICSVARSKELDILCLHDVGHAQFYVVMDTIHVITVVIVAVVVPSLCFRSVGKVRPGVGGGGSEGSGGEVEAHWEKT